MKESKSQSHLTDLVSSDRVVLVNYAPTDSQKSQSHLTDLVSSDTPDRKEKTLLNESQSHLTDLVSSDSANIFQATSKVGYRRNPT